jgi:hypothetical protein
MPAESEPDQQELLDAVATVVDAELSATEAHHEFRRLVAANAPRRRPPRRSRRRPFPAPPTCRLS